MRKNAAVGVQCCLVGIRQYGNQLTSVSQDSANTDSFYAKEFEES
jgi:hypothetical protein